MSISEPMIQVLILEYLNLAKIDYASLAQLIQVLKDELQKSNCNFNIENAKGDTENFITCMSIILVFGSVEVEFFYRLTIIVVQVGMLLVRPMISPGDESWIKQLQINTDEFVCLATKDTFTCLKSQIRSFLFYALQHETLKLIVSEAIPDDFLGWWANFCQFVSVVTSALRYGIPKLDFVFVYFFLRICKDADREVDFFPRCGINAFSLNSFAQENEHNMAYPTRRENRIRLSTLRGCKEGNTQEEDKLDATKMFFRC